MLRRFMRRIVTQPDEDHSNPTRVRAGGPMIEKDAASNTRRAALAAACNVQASDLHQALFIGYFDLQPNRYVRSQLLYL